jgi:hypothetical protein
MIETCVRLFCVFNFSSTTWNQREIWEWDKIFMSPSILLYLLETNTIIMIDNFEIIILIAIVSHSLSSLFAYAVVFCACTSVYIFYSNSSLSPSLSSSSNFQRFVWLERDKPRCWNLHIAERDTKFNNRSFIIFICLKILW